ncbi:hypothetical protein BP6252_04418 [Coleophoma cylindrospora]|uniref:Major facilitator superfamily (MFS) profile domain-containing protein n=1 Tax=Coleophoma cylindrospora TaxID=1849047 RepID=A0A3D8S0X1_9HELO|nr:hypothetical protein BP6252_04418 [Coleophoma cylindrospora]
MAPPDRSYLGQPASHNSAVTEAIVHQQEPLLINGDTEAQARVKTKETKVSYMSLPKKGQLALLCIARMADPLAATSIQSYMFYQLKFFDPTASPTRISTQAGILVGAKTAAAVCTGMLWGRVADSEWGGRKFVLMVGLLSAGLACVGYGFSKTFTSAVAWQVFGGAMSSNVGITRCVVAELNPEKRFRTRALLLLPLFASAGMLIGPLIGGLLSSPGGSSTAQAYPYAPPNLFVAAVYGIAAIGVFFGLEETLESLHHEGSFIHRIWKKFKRSLSRDKSQDHDYVPVDSETPSSPVVELTDGQETSQSQAPPKRKATLPFRRIWTFNVICTMVAHFIIAGHLATFTNLWAIFLSTPIGQKGEQHPPLQFDGGLGMEPKQVGFAMSALGAIGVILQLVIYPKLNDRLGTIKIWRGSLFIFPIVYLMAPFLSLVASAGSADIETSAIVWLTMGFVLLLFVMGRTGVTPATTLLINDCTPHPSVRGTIHTAGTVIGNSSRSLFPIIAFWIFGKGQQIGVVGLGFWFVACLAILACVASKWVTEGSNGKEIVLEGDEPEQQPDGANGNGKPPK